MTKIIDDPISVFPQVEDYYGRWRDEMRQAAPEMAKRLPEWGALDYGQTLAWMSAYVANLELACRLGVAIDAVVEA